MNADGVGKDSRIETHNNTQYSVHPTICFYCCGDEVVDPCAESCEGTTIAGADANLHGKVILPGVVLGEQGDRLFVGEADGSGCGKETDYETAKHVGSKVLEIKAACRERHERYEWL